MSVIFLIKQLVEQLRLGNIVAFPTETIYALAVDGTNGLAIEKLYALKKRATNKPFTIFVDGVEAILKIAEVSIKQKLFIEALIPAPITFILQKRSHFLHCSVSSKEFSGLKVDMVSPDETIAVRVPNHALSLQIINTFNKPIVATSANLSGEESMNDPHEIKTVFKDVYVPSGLNEVRGLEVMPSTVVSLLNNKISILRNGALDEEILLEIWEDVDNYCG